MKKLMTTMAALVTGLCVWAESETSFTKLENVFDASSAGESWATDTSTGGKWGGSTETLLTDTSKVELTTIDDKKVLKLETGSDRLIRYINADQSAFTIAESNVYFDVHLDTLGESLDNLPENLPDDAKFVLFMLDASSAFEGETGALTGTNLYAIAGNPNGQGGKVLLKYNCTELGNTRLTIKGYSNVLNDTATYPCAGYLVFKDGEDNATSGQAPLQIELVYPISDNTVDWANGISMTDYLDGKVKSTVATWSRSLALSIQNNTSGAVLTSLDFVGRTHVTKVEINNTGFPFIGADSQDAGITLENVEIDVVPSENYDATNQKFTGGGTIYVRSTNKGTLPIVTVSKGGSYLTAIAKGSEYWTDHDDYDYAWTYAFSAGNDIGFTAVSAAVSAKLTIDDAETVVSFSSFADALVALSDSYSGATKAEFTLNRDATIDSINISDVEIVLDLNGCTLTGTDTSSNGAVVYANNKMTIKDSSVAQTGRIVVDKTATEVTVAVAVVENASGFSIEGGIFDGAVTVTDTEAGYVTLSGGSYLASANTDDASEFALKAYFAEGKAATKETVGDVDYWVVGDKAAETTWKTLLGEPDESGAYLIDNAAELLKFAQYVNGTDVDALATAGVTFKLSASIDMADQTWPGIGVKGGVAFAGTFDGARQTISNLTLPHQNYAALFNSVAAATIKDVTVNVVGFAARTTELADGAADEYGGAAIVGYSTGGAMISGCTATGTICGTHNVAGICARTYGNITLTNCKNEANITTSYSKIGGMIAIAEGGTVVIENCTNTGTVTADGTYVKDGVTYNAGEDGVSGILAYEQNNPTVTIKNCVSTGELKATNASSEATGTAKIGTIKAAGTSATYAEVSGNTARADLVASVDKAIDGLTFATVDEKGTATFVANSALALGSETTYKVMASGAAYTMTALGSITFDTSLATVTVTQGGDFASADDYTLSKVENEKVITYTLAKKATVPTLDPTDAAGTTYESNAAATAAAEAFNEEVKSNPELIKVPDVVTSDDDKVAYRALFQAVADGTTVKLDFTSDAKADLETAAETAVESIKLQTFAASDGTSAQNLLTVEKAIPGLWYTLLTGTDTPANLPTAHSQQATSSTVTFNVTKDADADRAFFRMKITTTKVQSTGLTD